MGRTMNGCLGIQEEDEDTTVTNPT